ncbi:hypothetical protein [Polynucleobacter sp.]|uniref:hypothetical protein n=1 Tax=Polynucleobacter sp. TaxID=2029855 RepID=UPI003F69ED77
MMKLSEVTPTSVLQCAPHTISTLSGKNLTPDMVIKVPCFRDYYQRVDALVEAGEIHQVGNTYYFKLRQSPFHQILPSLPIDHDITLDQLMEMHLPTEEDAYDR